MFSAPKLLIILGLVFLILVLPALTALAIALARKE
jgi:hypothetical protein